MNMHTKKQCIYMYMYMCTVHMYTRNVLFWHCLLLYFSEKDDYTALTRTVTLTPIDPRQCVSIMIEDDSVLEETESLTVSLSPTGLMERVQLSQLNTTLVITDDDSKRPIIHV